MSFCPVCNKAYTLFNPASDVYWEIQGGDFKKKLQCAHKWVHPNFTMWYCSECGAVYRFMCGCGGSEYVCEKHHVSHQEMMVKEEGSVEAYLNKNSW